MGTLSITKESHLYWLGRYIERAYSTLLQLRQYYDKLLDGKVNYQDYCATLGIPDIYQSPEEFIQDMLFNEKNFSSVVSSLRFAYDNAVVLRETLGSGTLSYIQMACNAMELAKNSKAPMIEAQWAIDDIMAFRGSSEDLIQDEQCRSILKCGIGVERVDLYLRLGLPIQKVRPAAERMLNTLYKCGLVTDTANRQTVEDAIISKVGTIDRWQLLNAVDGLFPEL